MREHLSSQWSLSLVLGFLLFLIPSSHAMSLGVSPPEIVFTESGDIRELRVFNPNEEAIRVHLHPQGGLIASENSVRIPPSGFSDITIARDEDFRQGFLRIDIGSETSVSAGLLVKASINYMPKKTDVSYSIAVPKKQKREIQGVFVTSVIALGGLTIFLAGRLLGKLLESI